ncbi:MAG: HAD hydrolase family protein [Faecalibacterium prausnitzii]|nr:HAD hydrolase family protein [Faecalibacterium prausnitzii]
MGKILLIDIDGTLVDYENRLPASAVEAVRRARAKGHRVYLCSGGEEIKAAADYVTTDVDKDGLYNAFVHLGLI